MASFVLPIISGLAGLFGGGSQKQTTQSTQQQQSGSQQGFTSGTSSTNPNLSPLQTMLENLFGSKAAALAENPIDLSGYEASGIKNINDSTDAASKNIANILASRGLSFSPYAGSSLAQPQIAAAGQQSQFINSLPLLMRQLQMGDISSLEDAFKSMPFGQTSTSSGTSDINTNMTGSSTSKGVQSSPGGMLAGLFGGLGAGLAAGGGGGGFNFPSLFGGSNMNTLNNLPLLTSGFGGGGIQSQFRQF